MPDVRGPARSWGWGERRGEGGCVWSLLLPVKGRRWQEAAEKLGSSVAIANHNKPMIAALALKSPQVCPAGCELQHGRGTSTPL